MIIFADYNFANARSGLGGYLGYSFSNEEMEGKNPKNHFVSHEIVGVSGGIVPFLTIWGLNYKFSYNGNSLTSHLIFNPFYTEKEFCWNVLIPTIGANGSYNLEKKIWGIAPQVDLVSIVLIYFKLNLTYRYNIYSQAKNTHEAGFTFSISYFADIQEANVRYP